MKRITYDALIVNDQDLDCKVKEPTLDDIKLGSLGFVPGDLEKYELIIYSGTLGKKILKMK